MPVETSTVEPFQHSARASAFVLYSEGLQTTHKAAPILLLTDSIGRGSLRILAQLFSLILPATASSIASYPPAL